MTAIKFSSPSHLCCWACLFLTFPGALAAAGVNTCRLRPALYRERKLLESEYWSQVGNDYTRHEALAKRLKEKINRIDTEYYRFIYTLAEFAVKGDSESLAACRAASVKDPIGRLLAALVWYLHEGRNDPGSFIASLPRTKDQLAVFWSLDTIYRHGQPNLPSGLPGVALPYG
jgi:hypothetical protein